MFPMPEFRAIPFEQDVWEQRPPELKLDDLELVDKSRPVKMSFILSFTNNRITQIARSLECLCRQTWKDFEVLICDDGSTQDMKSVFDKVAPYLNMKTFRLERDGFSADPSRGIRTLVPHAQGEIICTMQPEMLLVHEAAKFLYESHFKPIPADKSVLTYYVNMDRRPDIVDREKPRDENAPRFVCMKSGFMDSNNQFALDSCDWHYDTRAVMSLPGFWTHGDGLSHMNNHRVLEYDHWPWWFVSSMMATDSIWSDMPEMYGHAAIDFYLLNYRAIKGYIDICATEMMCFHQHHSHNTSISPSGEQAGLSAVELKKRFGL